MTLPVPVRVGILGAGTVVERYHLPVLGMMPGVSVQWICDVVEERARRLGHAFRVPKVFARLEDCTNVDVALVAIPLGYRRSALEHIFMRGWHAFCEKPFAATIAEHDWVLEQAERAGAEVGVGFMRRFYPGTGTAQTVLGRLPFGPLHEVWASEGLRQRGTGRDSDWYQTRPEAARGGVLIETGSHLIDQVLYVCGAESFTIDESNLCRRDGLENDVRVRGRIRFGRGEECPFGLAVSRVRDLYNAIVLCFDAVQLVLDVGADGGLYLSGLDGARLARLDDARGATTEASVYRAFFLEWHEFIGQCRSRKPSRAAAVSARLTTRFIEACYRGSA